MLWEPIFHVTKGECQTMMRVTEGRRLRVWYHAVIVENRPQSNFGGHQKRVHPTQKPVGLYVKLMAQHYPGVVLDPMAGVGTTGLAAKTLGWKAILIEQSELYCRRAAARLSGGIERLGGQEGLQGIG
jgi:DNA modification methylase